MISLSESGKSPGFMESEHVIFAPLETKIVSSSVEEGILCTSRFLKPVSNPGKYKRTAKASLSVLPPPRVRLSLILTAEITRPKNNSGIACRFQNAALSMPVIILPKHSPTSNMHYSVGYDSVTDLGRKWRSGVEEKQHC